MSVGPAQRAIWRRAVWLHIWGPMKTGIAFLFLSLIIFAGMSFVFGDRTRDALMAGERGGADGVVASFAKATSVEVAPAGLAATQSIPTAAPVTAAPVTPVSMSALPGASGPVASAPAPAPTKVAALVAPPPRANPPVRQRPPAKTAPTAPTVIAEAAPPAAQPAPEPQPVRTAPPVQGPPL